MNLAAPVSILQYIWTFFLQTFMSTGIVCWIHFLCVSWCNVKCGLYQTVVWIGHSPQDFTNSSLLVGNMESHEVFTVCVISWQ